MNDNGTHSGTSDNYLPVASAQKDAKVACILACNLKRKCNFQLTMPSEQRNVEWKWAKVLTMMVHILYTFWWAHPAHIDKNPCAEHIYVYKHLKLCGPVRLIVWDVAFYYCVLNGCAHLDGIMKLFSWKKHFQQRSWFFVVPQTVFDAIKGHFWLFWFVMWNIYLV